MSERVVITGVGPVTPLGDGAATVKEALLAGRTSVVRRDFRIDLADYTRLYVSPMPAEWHREEARDPMVLLTEECADYRDLRYTIRAMRLALVDAGLDLDRVDNSVGAVYAFEAPGMEVVVNRVLSMPPEAMMVERPQLYPLLSHAFYHTHSFFYVHVLGKALGLHGFSTCVHNACASGAFALETAAQRVRDGSAHVMLVAGAEAYETGARLQYLQQMETYADKPEMRPFDRTPTGFYAGEGGAALVLEARSHAEARGARIYGEYVGGAFAQQSWKHALPDAPSGRLSAAIREALHQAKLKPEQIDLVIPHGACSPVCDGYELQEIAKLWSDPADAALCPVKPFVGHQLGNCVIIEIILGLLMMQDGMVVGQPFKGSPVAQLPLAMHAENHAHDTKYMMKLATGFTGHDAALVFARE